MQDIENWLDEEPDDDGYSRRQIRTALGHLQNSGFIDCVAGRHNQFLYQIKTDYYHIGHEEDIGEELQLVIMLLNRIHGFMRGSADREDPVLTHRLDAAQMLHLRGFEQLLKLGTVSLPVLDDRTLTHIRTLVVPVNGQGAFCHVSVTIHAGLPDESPVAETISNFHLRQLLFRDGQLWAYGLDHSGDDAVVRWFSTDLILDVSVTAPISIASRYLLSDYFGELPLNRFHFLPDDRAVTVSFVYHDADVRAFLDSGLPQDTEISRMDAGRGLLVTFPARDNPALHRWLRQWEGLISDLTIRPDD